MQHEVNMGLWFVTAILLMVAARNEATAESVLRFLPLGATGAITHSLLAQEDVASRPIAISGYLPYSSGQVNTTYVNENGAISFQSPQEEPPQSAGPSLLQDAGETFLVAPFWTDYSVASGGSVKYETYVSGNAGTEDRLNLVSRFLVNRTSDLEMFDASWMILAEWRNRPPSSMQENVNASLTNTFQAVVITDGSNSSFAIFIYQCDLIHWPGLDSNYAKIGTTLGGGMEQVHELSGVESADDIDCSRGVEWVNIIFDLTLTSIGEIQSSSTQMPDVVTVIPSISPAVISISGTSSPTTTTTSVATTVMPSPTSSPSYNTPTMSVVGSSLSTPILVITIVLPLLAVIVVATIGVICVILTLVKKISGRRNKIQAVHSSQSLTEDRKPHPSPFKSGHSTATDEHNSQYNMTQANSSLSQAPLIETELNSPLSIHPQSP